MEYTPLVEVENTKKGCLRKYLCNPRHFSHRIIILFLTCFIAFGSFFCYDNPAALQTMFLRDLDLSYESYMGLYTWYSWPNVVMSIIGGILIDKFLGIRLGTILFGILTIIGQFLLALGVHLNKLWLMNLARFIFGIGAESLAVAQNTYAAIWFKDKELNIVYGLQISISRLGSTINANTMPTLYKNLQSSNDNKTALALSLLVASVTCIISFIFAIILGFLDVRAAKIRNKYCTKEKKSTVHWSDVLKFGYGFWTLCIICVLFYSSVFPFVSLAQMFFVQKYSIDVNMANLANSFIYVVSAVLSPIIGMGVDFLGRNLVWLTCGLNLLLLSHVLFAFSDNLKPYFLTILLGMAYSTVASSLWGIVTYMIPSKNQGSAFGIMQALMNLGLGTVALIAGSIVDKYGYFILEIFFIICMMSSHFVLIILFYWDASNKGILNVTARQRKKIIHDFIK